MWRRTSPARETTRTASARQLNVNGSATQGAGGARGPGEGGVRAELAEGFRRPAPGVIEEREGAAPAKTAGGRGRPSGQRETPELLRDLLRRLHACVQRIPEEGEGDAERET